ncbi:unnamed protein product, partial [Rotaria magnacalcarata]
MWPSTVSNMFRREITCPQCQTKVLRTEVHLDRGFQNEMKTLLIVCYWCQWDGILDNYQNHLDESHPNLTCEYCGEQFNSTNNFNEHKVSTCQKISVECLLKDFGCNERIVRANMKEHYMTEQHQKSVSKCIRQFLSHDSDRRIDTGCPRTTTESYNPDTVQFEELHGVLNILVGGIEALENDAQRLSNESLQAQVTLQTLEEQLPGLKLSMEESNGFLQGVNCNLDILKQDFTSLQEKVNDLQCVSYDGTFIWKITNVKEKMMDAQSERQTSIYSPPFYSSSNGYKMRARLYLNG